MSPAVETEILAQLAEIRARLDSMPQNGIECALHGNDIKHLTSRVEAIEDQQGKENFLKIAFGALGAGIVLALKWAISANWWQT